MSSRLEHAIALAVELHRGQTRKGGSAPYVLHPFAVAALVADHGGTEDEIAAALLHDAIEDSGGDAARARLRDELGPNVLAIVEGCTDTDRVPKPPWRERKEAFIASLAGAPASVRLVIAADKLHNARTTRRDLERLGPVVWERFRGGRDGSLWYYRRVAEELARGFEHPIVRELADEVSALATAADVA
ncbi:MAG: HD domain-containing protein [Gemmatimonadetes bacterium]|nr:HD domain-containing protein [Gemmatimonadota bacterium]